MQITRRRVGNRNAPGSFLASSLGAAFIFFSATVAQSAVITLDLVTNGPATAAPGTWQLYAATSTGDNDGIAGYNIPVLNALSLIPNIIGQTSSGTLVNGFTFNSVAGDVVFGGQDSTQPATIIYGVGNSGFNVPSPPSGLLNVGMPSIGDPFGPVLLASGTGNYLDLALGTANANVWGLGESATGGTRAEVEQVVISVTRNNRSEAHVPEPAPFLLLVLGLASLTSRRQLFVRTVV